MKNPLRYQMSEYDCGPTSLLNAISFLFEREEIPPEILINITLYCMDSYDSKGSPGKNGTSCTAMMFLSNWIDGFGQTGKLAVSSSYLSGKSVNLYEGSVLINTLHTGGVVVLRPYYDVPHYVLLTGEHNGSVLLFDPYYKADAFQQKDIIVTLEHPLFYNRIVPVSYFNRENHEIYSMGELDSREAVLLFRKQKMISSQNS